MQRYGVAWWCGVQAFEVGQHPASMLQGVITTMASKEQLSERHSVGQSADMRPARPDKPMMPDGGP